MFTLRLITKVNYVIVHSRNLLELSVE